MAVDIVVTTIFEPDWLEGYLENIRTNHRVDEVTIRIICDQMTPNSVYLAANNAIDRGFHIDCPSLDEQSAYLKKLGLEEDYIPWNTDNRRNIGFLRAWESGADVIISIDDDNYCLQESDFIGSHSVVADGNPNRENLSQAGGKPWFNICDMLESEVRDKIYARGFPYGARLSEHQATLSPLDSATKTLPVSVNAGLWLDEPDVDAITRLAQRPKISSARPGNVILDRETWSPINTQNTGLRREALPAYYYIRMGYPLGGMTIDRFGDILSGYFVQKCVKHLGHAVQLGSPVAEHRRSPHNLFKDLYHELAGIVIVEELLPWLQELRITGSNYIDAYACLAENIDANAEKFTGFVWDEGGRDFLRQTADNMRTWLSTIQTIGK